MLKAITFDFWQTLYADSEKNWQKRQAIRTKKCHAYLERRGYTCGLDDIGFGLEEAYNVVMTLWHQHRGVSVKRCMMRFRRGAGNSTRRSRPGSVDCVSGVLLS